ncbi:MAG: TldD/PmbA family protein, partial [Actinomycetota bacterium]
MLTGRDRLLEIASAGLDVAGAEAAEFLIVRDASGLTRFASNRIHQNVWREDGELRARVVLSGGRCGVASSHDLSPAGALETAVRARAVAEVAVADPEFAGLSWPAPCPRVDSFSEETAGADPQARAEAVKQALAGLPGGWEGAGAYETGGVEMALANSNGVRAYHPSSRCAFSILVSGRDSSGWAETTEFDRSRVDTAVSAARAARKAELSRHPIEIPAGTYPVVLEPCAVGALVQFLGYMGLGAKAYLEGRSFASGRLGQEVAHERVTIVDDALRAENLGVPFDFEGVPKQRVALIDHGVLSGVVWDLATARKAGRASTGHGLPAPNVDGPSAMHLE